MLYYQTYLHFNLCSFFAQLGGVKHLYADWIRNTVAILLSHIQQNGCSFSKIFVNVCHDPRTGCPRITFTSKLLAEAIYVHRYCGQSKKLEDVNRTFGQPHILWVPGALASGGGGGRGYLSLTFI